MPSRADVDAGATEGVQGNPRGLAHVNLDALVVEHHASVPSTQARMKARIRARESVHLHVVRAETQQAGMGTRGRTWASPPGGSWQTLAVHDADRSLARPGVTLAVGIGVATELRRHGAPVDLKWPNDLVARGESATGRKLGGILCEAYRGYLVVGVGLNVSNEPPPGGAALEGWSLQTAHDAVLSGILRALHRWSEGWNLAQAFAPFDALAGRVVAVRSGGATVEGCARGVDAQGGLRVDRAAIADGSVVSVGGPCDAPVR